MKSHDLRDWLRQVDEIGQLSRIVGAHWKAEIGAAAEVNCEKANPPVLLFDNITDYPAGYRVLTSATSNSVTLALTLGLPTHYSTRELIAALAGKLQEWEAKSKDFPPETLATGAVKENVIKGKDVDLFKFPAPLWHEQDGGRYIGTGCAVITRDPDTGHINVGTYRVMVHDKDTTGILIAAGHHGQLHMAKYHERGLPCPIAVSVGQDPLILSVSSTEVPQNVCEYNLAGAIKGERIPVVEGEITGLPIPAFSEITLEGWIPPDERRIEGPYGEYTGYYAAGSAPAPVIKVQAVYHRNNPILLGSPDFKPPDDSNYRMCVLRAAMIQDALEKAGIPDVCGVWSHQGAGSRAFLVVSIKQRYVGHARQAGFVAAQARPGAYAGRYIVVVDEDIDPTNIDDVVWAIATRSNPASDIDFIRRAWSGPADPMIRKPAIHFWNSRAVIDACRPYEWIKEFPPVATASKELKALVKDKWREQLG